MGSAASARAPARAATTRTGRRRARTCAPVHRQPPSAASTRMLEKRVTAILYGSDRNLWAGGPLQIRVVDLLAAGGPRLLSSATTDSATVELRLQLPFD